MSFPAARQPAHMDSMANMFDPDQTAAPEAIAERHRYDQDPARFFSGTEETARKK